MNKIISAKVIDNGQKVLIDFNHDEDVEVFVLTVDQIVFINDEIDLPAPLHEIVDDEDESEELSEDDLDTLADADDEDEDEEE